MRAGQGQLAFITGSAGRGKTTLAHEFARQAQLSDPELVVAAAGCNAHTGLGDPYLPFREALSLRAGDVEAKWAGGGLSRENAVRLWNLMPISIPALIDLGPELIGNFISDTALLLRVNALPEAATDDSSPS